MNRLLRSLKEAGVGFNVTDEREVKLQIPPTLPAHLRQELLDNRSELKSWLLEHSELSKDAITLAPYLPNYPLTEYQKQIWFMSKFAPNSPQFHMPVRYEVKGTLEIDIADRAINQLIERHTILRTTYHENLEGIHQLIHDDFSFSFSRHELTDVSSEGAKSKLEELSKNMRVTQFDLENEFPIRGLWLSTSTHGQSERNFLLLTLHHIACDGWSLEILIEEFSKIYTALSAGSTVKLPTIELTYHDYAYWLSLPTQLSLVAKEEEYWLTKLRDVDESYPLSGIGMRQSIANRSEAHFSVFESDLVVQVHQACKMLGLTPFMFVHGCFALFVAKYTGANTVSVGIPNTNRSQSKLNHIVGLFLNTQVLKVDIIGDFKVSDYFKHVKKTHLEAHQHNQTPFAKLVDLLGANRQIDNSPLFQIFLNTESVKNDTATTSKKLQLNGCVLEELAPEEVTAKYDIDLSFSFSDKSIGLEWIFKTDLFSYEDIDIYSQCLTHIIQQISNVVLTGNPAGADLSSINLLSAEQHDSLLQASQPRVVNYSNELNISQLFEEQVDMTPEHIALIENEKRLSYNDLNSAANQLARLLIRNGVNKGDLVGVCMQRSCSSVTVILALLKLGVGFVPLEVTYPSVRIEYIINDVGMKLMLMDEASSMALDLSATMATVIVDSAEVMSASAQHLITNLDLELSIDDRLSVLYTSGSTGNPKGVVLAHLGILNRFQWMWERYPFDNDVMCFKTAPGFVDAIWEMFGGMLKGQPTVIINNQAVHDLSELMRLIRVHSVTRLTVVPSVLREMMIEAGEFEACLVSLKYLTVSGENLSQQLLNEFCLIGSSTQLINLYGSSETAADVTYSECKAGDIVSIGRPIDNMACYVLDQNLSLLPNGAIGELYVSGPGVAVGYYDLPELTAACFLKNPLTNQIGHQVLFKTGDMVSRDDNGHLYYMGRSDDQVKIRGMRVVLGDIEAVLEQHLSVKKCVVILRGNNGKQLLVAYVVNNEIGQDQSENQFEDKPIVEQLTLFAKTKLPDHMLPSVIVGVDKYPLLYNGKIDKQALARRPVDANVRAYNAPQTEIEIRIVALWATLLDLKESTISRDAVFFELGGNSLQLTRLAKQIKQEFSVEMSVRKLFELTTLSSLANEIELRTLREQAAEALNKTDSIVELEF